MTPKHKQVLNILPDASVWIDYYNPNKAPTPEVKKLRSLMDNDALVWTCPPVYQEVLQGIRGENEFQRIKGQLLKCEQGGLDTMQVTDRAVEIYRTLRKMGITIRKANDCLIAAYALLNDLVLLHNDRDFDPIEQYFGLKVVQYASPQI
jgi:predicted nucleic acid-binding protein